MRAAASYTTIMRHSTLSARSPRDAQIGQLRDVGYVVVPRFVPIDPLTRLNQVARAQLAARAEPLELEADLQYPGAPVSKAAPGGGTVRRLLDAYARDPIFAEWGTTPVVRDWMESYFNEKVLMSRVHHNCVMTKQPRYGSLTHWHRDFRYWSFERDNLVSIWVALGEETIDNGALWLVPGSHRMKFESDQFDDAKFFRSDRPDNAEIIRSAQVQRLSPGDAVFFHCNTLHSANRNVTDAVKFSLVFTYHGAGNSPKAGSRSASRPEVLLG